LGKKIRTSSDNSKDRDHPAGSVVMFIQPSYGEYGNVHSKHYRQSKVYWQRANELYEELLDLHRKVYEVEPSESGFRDLYQSEYDQLMYKYFVVGSSFINSVWLTYQHFANEALGHWFLHPDNPPENTDLYNKINQKDLSQKMKYIHQEILTNSSLQRHPGYDALVGKFEQMRNNINHPTQSNSYNATDNEWDSVPLAWLLSGQFKTMFEDIRKYTELLFNAWQVKEKELQRPGTINIKQRGLVSDRKPNILRTKN
jgi:hypothetical protein